MAYDIVAYNLLYLCVAGVTLVIGILTVIYWHYAKGKSQTYEEPTKCVAAGSDLETSKEISNLEPARQEPDFPPSGACPVNQQAIGLARKDDIDPYLKLIPEHNRWKLNKELDFDNNFHRDLIEIARYITNWKSKLKVPLELTDEDVSRIQQEDLNLRQEEVLHVWREKKKFDATYRNLLKCMVASKCNHKTAKKICELEIFQTAKTPLPNFPPRESSGACAQATGTIPECKSQINLSLLFPDLHVDDPDVLSQLREALYDQTLAIKTKFARLILNLQKDLEENGVRTQDVVTFLIVQNQNLKSQLDGCTCLVNVIRKLDDIVFSFFDYDIAEHLVEQFGSEVIQTELKAYKNSFEEFAKRRVYECPINAFGEPVSTEKVLVMKTDTIIEGLTTGKLKRLTYKLSKILDDKLSRVVRVERGCVKITFQIFEESDYFLNISADQMHALYELGVMSISYGGRTISTAPSTKAPLKLPALEI